MQRTLIGYFTLALVALMTLTASRAAEPQELLVYFGTYTNGGKSQGIYRYRLDLATGKLSPIGVTSGIKNPSFLAIHPGGQHLYAVSEVAEGGKPTGAVTAFSLNAKTGELTALNHQSSEGGGPCHVAVDKSGKCVLVANYGGGSIASLPLASDGSLQSAGSAIQHEGSSIDPARQKEPHAHSINVSPDNRFAFAADLGLDKILVYKLDPAAGKLVPHDPPFAKTPAGGGPRHFAFHPDGRYAYVCNEMKSSVTAFAYDAEKGTLTEIQTITTLPADKQGLAGNSTAEIQVHPSGKFLYCSNRGHDSLAIFKIDPATGKLTAAGHQSTLGRTPRNFGIDPTGKYILACNQGSDTVAVFQVDQATGALAQVGEPITVPVPVCVKFLAVE
ncbi:MAG: lactonase family protein [Pirellulaceae bacterium]|jgi:6-phosphogluconolactonase|nr:lactonase family protein [Pirellulaceae bacterium]